MAQGRRGTSARHSERGGPLAVLFLLGRPCRPGPGRQTGRPRSASAEAVVLRIPRTGAGPGDAADGRTVATQCVSGRHVDAPGTGEGRDGGRDGAGAAPPGPGRPCPDATSHPAVPARPGGRSSYAGTPVRRYAATPVRRYAAPMEVAESSSRSTRRPPRCRGTWRAIPRSTSPAGADGRRCGGAAGPQGRRSRNGQASGPPAVTRRTGLFGPTRHARSGWGDRWRDLRPAPGETFGF